MSRSQGAVIDLTEESPPANTRHWFSSFGAAPGPGTHILEWSFGSHAHPSPSDSFGRDTASSSSAQRAARPVADPIVVGSDDEDEEDMSFTITGQSEPIRRTYHLQRSVPLNSPAASSTRPSSASAGSSLRFHDSIGRGPHGSDSRSPQSIGMLGSSSAAQHPLLPQHRAALPSASATAARRGGGAIPPTRSDGGFMSRLSGEFSFGGMAGFGFGPSYSMEVIGNLIRGLQSNAGAGYQQGPERQVPQDYDPKWTHPYEVQPGFTHNIIEPPVDLDTYFDDKAVVTGPLPDTTPICSCCRHALVTGANGDERIWVLPCGHVIDGRCVNKLSGIAPPLGPDAVVAERTSGKGKGKAKAVEPPEDEPPAKASRTSSRNRTTASAPATAKEATPKKPKKPKRFNCPVRGCGQRCTKEPGSKYSAWEVFV